MSRNSHLNDKTRLLDTHPHESQAGAYSRMGWRPRGAFLQEQALFLEFMFAGEKKKHIVHTFVLFDFLYVFYSTI